MNKKEELEKWWNMFCEKVFQYGKGKKPEELSELETTIFCVKAIDGVVNIELIGHSDFPELAQKLEDLGKISIKDIPNI